MPMIAMIDNSNNNDDDNEDDNENDVDNYTMTIIMI